jgi:ribose 5-phosphate isomerase B
MNISVGSDHRGIEQRKIVATAVAALNLQIDDRGTHSTESCDYPDIAADVAQRVATGKSDRGILICGTGIGMSIAANKVPGIRAAVCHDRITTALSRQHNNANVLCLSGSLAADDITEMVTVWLTTAFEGGRHKRRVEKISELDAKYRMLEQPNEKC